MISGRYHGVNPGVAQHSPLRFSTGRSDPSSPSIAALADMYQELGVTDESINYVTKVDAGHGFVTEQGTVRCDSTRPDFLIDCDFDQAGEILGHLYGELSLPAPVAASVLADRLLTFDQSLWVAGDYVIRYLIDNEQSAIILRIWHGREDRPE